VKVFEQNAGQKVPENIDVPALSGSKKTPMDL